MDIILELQYLPPIQYFSKFVRHEHIVIDDTEVFKKQSYRNRCRIAGANNIQELIIPLKGGKTHLGVIDVEIDNSRKWQREHWHSLKSAYGKAPYYEHYAPYFQPLYEKDQARLFNFNLELLQLCMRILKIQESRLVMLSSYKMDRAIDFRNCIHPKKRYRLEDPEFTAKPYMQVFSEKHGFIPNLSIIDLIFNFSALSFPSLVQE